VDLVSYSNAWEEIVNRLLYQVYYRLLGMAPVLNSYRTTLAAAEWLAANIRGGKVSQVIVGRVAQWDDIAVTPGVPGSPTMSIWIIGLDERAQQSRTLLLRKGFWTLYLPNIFNVGTTVQTFRALPNIASAPFLPRGGL
jgi:hypothetical protein